MHNIRLNFAIYRNKLKRYPKILFNKASNLSNTIYVMVTQIIPCWFLHRHVFERLSSLTTFGTIVLQTHGIPMSDGPWRCPVLCLITLETSHRINGKWRERCQSKGYLLSGHHSENDNEERTYSTLTSATMGGPSSHPSPLSPRYIGNPPAVTYRHNIDASVSNQAHVYEFRLLHFHCLSGVYLHSTAHRTDPALMSEYLQSRFYCNIKKTPCEWHPDVQCAFWFSPLNI